MFAHCPYQFVIGSRTPAVAKTRVRLREYLSGGKSSEVLRIASCLFSRPRRPVVARCICFLPLFDGKKVSALILSTSKSGSVEGSGLGLGDMLFLTTCA